MVFVFKCLLDVLLAISTLGNGLDARKGLFCASTVCLVRFAKILSECPSFSECRFSLDRERFSPQPSVAAASDRWSAAVRCGAVRCGAVGGV